MGLPVPAPGAHFVGKLFINVESAFPEGWVETYHLRSTNYVDAKADLVSLWMLRKLMLAQDCTLVYAVVSDEGIKGDSLLAHPDPGNLVGDYGTTENVTIPPWNVCLVRLESGALYRTMRPIRGLPNDVILTKLPAFSATWFTALQAFLDEVRLKVFNHIKVKPGDPDAAGNYRLITNYEIERFSERRSGRPFGLLRGRSRPRVA